MGLPGGDNALSGGERNAFGGQRVEKLLRRVLGERTLFPGGRVVEQCAIFGDDAVEQVELLEHTLQVRKLTACDHDEFTAGLAEAAQGFQGGFVYGTVCC